MRKSLLIAAALLGSTALAAPGFAQDATPTFTLSGTGGGIGLNVPSYNAGAFGHVASGNMLGGMIGVSGQTTVGGAGEWGVVLGINAYGSFGVGMSSWTDSVTTDTIITGVDAAAVSGRTFNVGAGSVALAITSPGGAATSVGVPTALTGTVNAGGVQPDAAGKGFVVVAGTHQPGAGAGFIAIGDPTGGYLEIQSTDGSAKLKTDVTRSIFYGGADLTIGMAGTFDSATKVQVYAGPSVRALSQGITTAYTADLVEVPAPSILPTFTIALNDQLMSTYLGGVFGASASFQAQPGVTFTLGAEGGVYSVHSTWNEHDTYSTCCGVDSATGNSPNLSVNGPTHTADLGTRAAFSAKANGGVSWDLEGNKSIGLSGNVGYLSAVPTVDHAGVVGGGGATTTFGWGSMITYGIAGTFTGHF